MLSPDIFTEWVTETANLLNCQCPNKNVIYALFNKFKNGFEPDDVCNALETLATTGEKINYPNIRKHLHQSVHVRKENEWDMTKERERLMAEDIMTSPEESKLRLRSIIIAIKNGPKYVERLAQEYEEDIKPEEKKCSCKDGYFWFKDLIRGRMYSSVGQCADCHPGPSNIPKYDPRTMRRVQ